MFFILLHLTPTFPQPSSSMSNLKTAIRRVLCSLIILTIAFVLVVISCIIHSTEATALVAVFLLFAMVILAIVWFCLWIGKRKRKTAPDKGEDIIIDHVSGMPRKFSTKDLEFATDNFRKRLGGGGFGAVFEGSLDDGTKVAVKRLDLNLSQGSKEFLAEVKTIGCIHHFNLVKLVGFCAENSHKLLVYEYMSNGSLDRWIFHGNLILDWPTRNKIILHMARGLTYLHEECSRRIIHLDIKPQNILLDEEFNAKLSDFGLSRFIDRNESEVETAVRGTRGYMAPEWFTNRGISEKVDVYSFGIVVMEILCGRKNLDRSQPEEDQVLLYLVRRKAEEDRLCDVVGARNGDVLQNEAAVVKMMRLAIWCSMDDSRRRPSMSIVVKVLEDGLEVENIVDLDDPMELLVDVSEFGSVLQSAEVLSGPR